MRPPALFLSALLMAVVPVFPAAAQGMQVGFSGLRQDTRAPVEVTSDSLEVDNATGQAVFLGNVVVAQGELRLAAPRVEVDYGTAGEGIRAVRASGGVTLATAAEAAEAQEARYDVTSGALVMSGSVLLTQGGATIAGERLVADLTAGTGRMEGRVRTVFQPGSGN
ncbi:MAG: lipopolysaccharide transport periplasmic protein LptA [Gemmobacter sp.]